MALLVQKIKGRSVNRITVTGSDDDVDVLKALLEGEVTKYEQESTGGSVTAHPDTLNTQKFSSKKDGVSVSVTVRHVKPTVKYPDIRTAVIGKLDCDWSSAILAEECNIFYNNVK